MQIYPKSELGLILPSPLTNNKGPFISLKMTYKTIFFEFSSVCFTKNKWSTKNIFLINEKSSHFSVKNLTDFKSVKHFMGKKKSFSEKHFPVSHFTQTKRNLGMFFKSMKSFKSLGMASTFKQIVIQINENDCQFQHSAEQFVCISNHMLKIKFMFGIGEKYAFSTSDRCITIFRWGRGTEKEENFVHYSGDST